MKIILSDFHLGSPLFKMQNKLMKLLESPSVEEVYILGDILDKWEARLSKILVCNEDIIEYINECGKVKLIIKGNHDPDLDVLQEIFSKIPVMDRYETTLCGKKVLMLHGHRFDDTGCRNRLFYPIHYLLQRIGIDIKDWTVHRWYKFSAWRQDLTANDLISNAEKKLFEKYSDEYDIIFAGHTHVKKIYDSPKCKYINCGSVLYKPSYVEINGNKITIKSLKGV